MTFLHNINPDEPQKPTRVTVESWPAEIWLADAVIEWEIYRDRLWEPTGVLFINVDNGWARYRMTAWHRARARASAPFTAWDSDRISPYPALPLDFQTRFDLIDSAILSEA